MNLLIDESVDRRLRRPNSRYPDREVSDLRKANNLERQPVPAVLLRAVQDHRPGQLGVRRLPRLGAAQGYVRGIRATAGLDRRLDIERIGAEPAYDAAGLKGIDGSGGERNHILDARPNNRDRRGRRADCNDRLHALRPFRRSSRLQACAAGRACFSRRH
jgi:hypothetical protein